MGRWYVFVQQQIERDKQKYFLILGTLDTSRRRESIACFSALVTREQKKKKKVHENAVFV